MNKREQAKSYIEKMTRKMICGMQKYKVIGSFSGSLAIFSVYRLIYATCTQTCLLKTVGLAAFNHRDY